MRWDNDTSVQPQLSQWGRLAVILEGATAYENGNRRSLDEFFNCLIHTLVVVLLIDIDMLDVISHVECVIGIQRIDT